MTLREDSESMQPNPKSMASLLGQRHSAKRPLSHWGVFEETEFLNFDLNFI